MSVSSRYNIGKTLQPLARPPPGWWLLVDFDQSLTTKMHNHLNNRRPGHHHPYHIHRRPQV
ncbi:hypothetical protein BD779DRAFT_1488453, partial [Infundibulicybe gibba]